MSIRKVALKFLCMFLFILFIVPALAQDKEGYEIVQPGEFKLELAAKSLDFTNGGKCVDSGEGIELKINGYLLTVTGVSNCKIYIKELGPIKIMYGSELWLTPEQKTKAKTLK